MWSRTISRITIVWSSVLAFSCKYELNHEMSRNTILLHRFTYKTQTTRRTFLPLLYSRPPCFQEKQCSSAWSPVYIPSADMIIFQWCKHTLQVVAMASNSQGSWWAPGSIFSVQKPRGNQQNRPWNTERRFLRPPTHIHWHMRHRFMSSFTGWYWTRIFQESQI